MSAKMYGPLFTTAWLGLMISDRITDSRPKFVLKSSAHSMPSWPRPPAQEEGDHTNINIWGERGSKVLALHNNNTSNLWSGGGTGIVPVIRILGGLPLALTLNERSGSTPLLLGFCWHTDRVTELNKTFRNIFRGCRDAINFCATDHWAPLRSNKSCRAWFLVSPMVCMSVYSN